MRWILKRPSYQIARLDVFQASFWSRCHFSAPSSDQRWLTAVFAPAVSKDGRSPPECFGRWPKDWVSLARMVNYLATVEGWEEGWLIILCQENGKRGVFSIGMGLSGRWLGLVRDCWSRRWCWEQGEWLDNERLGIPARLHKCGLMRGKLPFILYEQTKLRKKALCFVSKQC